MNIIKNLFRYGFHDTTADFIRLRENQVEIFFSNGIYELDYSGREVKLTPKVEMQIKVDTRFCRLEDMIEVREIFPKYKKIRIHDIEKGSKYRMDINNIYYSRFNNTILLDCTIGNSDILISIEECLDIYYAFTFSNED